jgi:uncharacterized protein (DUF427 family)
LGCNIVPDCQQVVLSIIDLLESSEFSGNFIKRLLPHILIHMKAIWNGVVIAESDETISIENNEYFPPSSVEKQYFQPSTHTSTCIWKGLAHYYNVVVDGKHNENAAWYYPVPKAGSVDRVGQDFANYVAFWNGITVEE